MATDHWFDALHKRLLSPTSRRAALRGAIVLATGLFAGGRSTVDAARKKDLCALTFPRKRYRKQRLQCRRRRKRCRRRGTAFCVIDTKRQGKRERSVCCPRGKKCCQSSFACVPKAAECCHNEPKGYCVVGETCCQGKCLNCPEGQTLNQSTCECESSCPSNLTQCGDRCVNTNTDPDNCGGCNRRCGDLVCRQGRCCMTGLEEPHWCNPQLVPNLACCSGVCLENGQCQVG